MSTIYHETLTKKARQNKLTDFNFCLIFTHAETGFNLTD